MKHPHPAPLQRILLEWFDAEARPLPWRLNPSAYGTWVSEIMLQQTTVATVISYWAKFMSRFPDVESLAAADESEVLALWSGLGYYRRARYLHQAARQVQNHGRGQLPKDRRSWQELPGIGAYTSGAIASIAGKEVVPAIDGNARRVISRWLFDDPQEASSLKPAALERLGSTLVDSRRPGDWNQAVMELGATLCSPTGPSCSSCPVLDHCRAGLAGTAEEIPMPTRGAVSSAAVLVTVVLKKGDQVRLIPPGERELLTLEGHRPLVRNDSSGLHEGLYSLPTSPWYLLEKDTLKALQDNGLVARWLGGLETGASLGQECEIRMGHTFSHSITRYRLQVQVWEVHCPDLPVFERGIPGVWVRPSDPLPVSKLVTKSLRQTRNVKV